MQRVSSDTLTCLLTAVQCTFGCFRKLLLYWAFCNKTNYYPLSRNFCFKNSIYATILCLQCIKNEIPFLLSSIEQIKLNQSNNQVMLCLGVKLAKKFSLIVFDGQTHFIIDQDCDFLLGVLDFLFGFV